MAAKDSTKASEPHLPLEEEPPSVQAYANGKVFARRNADDFGLWLSAGSKLDGLWGANQARHDKQLTTFPMLGVAKEQCGGAALTRCYYRDNGCAYNCLDSIQYDVSH